MFDLPQSFTPVSEIGEFGLIKRITEGFQKFNAATLLGIGDDAAVLDAGNGQVWLYSTDLMMEYVHFDLSYTPPVHLGYKLAVTNFSDILAMNGKPFALSVSLGLSNYHSIELVEAIYEGINIACKEFQVDLIGGDTSGSRRDLFLSASVIGKCPGDRVAKRSGARPSDLVCVTGDLGAAYAGLQILEREKTIFQQNPEIQPDFMGLDYVIQRQLRPTVRKDIIEFFEANQIIPSAMVDVSDGLASELNHICKSSNLGAKILAEKINIDYQSAEVAEQFKLTPLQYALFGGEDYELLFTITPQQYELIKNNPDIRVIGFMSANMDKAYIEFEDGSQQELLSKGFNHFQK